MPVLGVRDKVKGHIPGRAKEPSYANAGSKSSSSQQKSGIRGHVSGLVHRGSNDAPSHQARPINELRDPNSFAPPPRRTGTGLAPAPPPSTANRSVVSSPSRYEDPRGPRGPPPEKQSADPALVEWQQQHGQQQEQEVEEQPKGPYRVDTSGLRTDHLPPPPGRRDGANVKALPPPSYESAMGQRSSPAPAPPPRANTVPKGPSLPPRLPPRTNSTATTSSENSEPAQMNQGAVNRLGAAGVSVPGLGIGKPNASPSPPPPPRQQSAGTPVNELQNRFSKLRTTNQAAEEQPAEGTSWAQKQAALKTASNFNKDPSSVSMADAKSAAGTANNFRQRHGEQVASGVKSANSLNQKYGVTNKIGAFNRGQQEQQQGVEPATTTAPAPPVAPQASGIAGKKKPPPPPPPKKKPGLGGNTTAAAPAQRDDEPPPIPMSTRPTF